MSMYLKKILEKKDFYLTLGGTIMFFFVHEGGGHFIIEKQLFSLRGARETLIIAGETNYLKEGGLLQDTGRYHNVFSLKGGWTLSQKI